jgi:hypothetical protein
MLKDSFLGASRSMLNPACSLTYDADDVAASSISRAYACAAKYPV